MKEESIEIKQSKKNKKIDKKANKRNNKKSKHLAAIANVADNVPNAEKNTDKQIISNNGKSDDKQQPPQKIKPADEGLKVQNIDEQQRIETKVLGILRNKDGKTTQSEYKHAMTYISKAFAIDYRFDTGTNYLAFACQLFPNSKPVVFKRVHLYDLELMDNLHSIQTTRLNARGQGPSRLGMKERAQTGVNKDRRHILTMIKAKLNLKDNPTEWLPAMGLTKGVVIEILHGLGPVGKVAESEHSR